MPKLSLSLTTTQKAALIASGHYVFGTGIVAVADAVSTTFNQNGHALISDPTEFALVAALVGYLTHAAHAYASNLSTSAPKS